MSNRRKVDAVDRDAEANGTASAPDETVKASPKVKVGDIVIYAHRPMTAEVDAPAVIRMPMVVTTVHGDGRMVNGVVLNDNFYVGFTGAKVIADANQGDGPGEWQLRT